MNNNGYNSLIIASLNGHLKIVKELAPISNIHHINNQGQSAFK